MAKPKRLYVPLDSSFYEDARVLQAHPLARYVFVCSLAMSKRLGTNGLITGRQVEWLASDLVGIASDFATDSVTDIASELVATGLWVEEGADFRIRAWSRWNDSSDEVDDLVAAKREGGIKGNHERWHVNPYRPKDGCPLCPTPSHTDRTSDSHSESDTESNKIREDRDKREISTYASDRSDRSRLPAPVDEEVGHYRVAQKWGIQSDFSTHDALRAALAQTCGYDLESLSASERGGLNTVIKKLLDRHARPSDVHERAANYRLIFPDAALTAPAIERHWGLCAKPPERRAQGKPPPDRQAGIKAFLARQNELNEGAS